MDFELHRLLQASAANKEAAWNTTGITRKGLFEAEMEENE
jgi:hypothetical protein